jgi:hypothetical protein
LNHLNNKDETLNPAEASTSDAHLLNENDLEAQEQVFNRCFPA